MDNITRTPEPLQWSEGLTLSPQHFQQSDRYWHSRVRHLMSHLQPYYWGIIELKLDLSALNTGRIVVQSLHAVMPDGLLVQYPAEDQTDALQLDLSSEPAIRDNEPVMVQLAVPVHTTGAASSASTIQRYDSVAGALEPDENTGDGAVPVGRLRARLSLQLGERLPSRYIALPLLKVQRDLSGHHRLTGYQPPLLRIGASSFLADTGLQSQLETLAARLRHKARELLGAVDDTTAGITNNYQRQIVKQLIAALPEFEVLVRMPQTHPLQCYLALARMLGPIAAIGTDPMPLLLDPYQHDDVAPGFAQAIQHIMASIAKLNAAYAAVAFERQREDVFTCTLPQGMRTDRLIVEIKATGGQSLRTAGQWLRHAVIASAGMIAPLRQRRLLGGRVRPLSESEAASLGASSGSFYEITNQAVQQDEKLMPVIQRDTVLHIEGSDGSSAPGAIVLYVPSRNAAEPQAARSNGRGVVHG